MNTEAIKGLIYADEFYPFRIFHKKGKVYDITQKEFCWVSPFGVYVVETDSNGHRVMNILSPKYIEKVLTHEEAV